MRCGPLWLLLGALSVPGVASGPAPFLAGGIQVHERDHARWTAALGEAGLNTVAVTVYAKQGAWNRAHLWWEDEEPAVLAEIRAAKARGLLVVLILRVALDHAFAENEFLWHGMIMPESPEEIRAWFERYTEFVSKWAAIAEDEGVDLLGVGSEMNSLAATLPLTRWGNLKNYRGYAWYQRLQRGRARRFADELEPRRLWARGYPNYATLDEFVNARFERSLAWARQAHLRQGAHTLRRINDRRRLLEQCWIRLIGEARRSYDGPLTYAANFDNYAEIGFWPHLDVLGINGYFSLRASLAEAAEHEAQLAHFTRRWDGILGQIERFERSQGIANMPFLFTELGYTFRRHSTVEPWAHGGFSVVGWKGKRRQLVVWEEQPIDYDERRLALEGLRAAHRQRQSGLIGILYWKLSTDPGHESIEPFVACVGRDSADRLPQELSRFVSADR